MGALHPPHQRRLYTYLAVAGRQGIIREEMDGQPGMLMPVLNPAELWRNAIAEIEQRSTAHRPSASRGAGAVAWSASPSTPPARSALQRNPQIWYHIQTKERDEPRPKSGILRTREFIMKDSYSLDRDMEGLEASYQKHIEVYRRIYDRCGLTYWMVESDVGMMGGSGAHEFMAPSSSGEDEVALCSNCDYAANVERRGRGPAAGVPRAVGGQETATPGITTVGTWPHPINAAATSKAMVLHREGEVVLAGQAITAARSQRRPRCGGAFRPASPEDRCHVRHRSGSIGPVGTEFGHRRRGASGGTVRRRREPNRPSPAGIRAGRDYAGVRRHPRGERRRGLSSVTAC